ncbi:hypothetical protein ACLI09_15820 [Flavobacterium sp. RHBU_24]|uniref:hypothetical protein n=1 Tax=Flavobacterium sp. RHBU_24 TaxID=3391185 RepID=UPI003984A4B8
MPHININANTTTNLFSITLDQYQWTSLTVNGTKVPMKSNTNTVYTESVPGPIIFTAVVNSVSIVNPDNVMLIKGPDNTGFFCGIHYAQTATNTVTLYGVLAKIDDLAISTTSYNFSQAGLTGSYYLVN